MAITRSAAALPEARATRSMCLGAMAMPSLAALVMRTATRGGSAHARPGPPALHHDDHAYFDGHDAAHVRTGASTGTHHIAALRRCCLVRRGVLECVARDHEGDSNSPKFESQLTPREPADVVSRERRTREGG